MFQFILLEFVSNCRRNISIVSKNPSKKHLLQQFINYKDIVLPRDTRQKAVPSKCSCYICLVGSDKTRKPTYQKNKIEGKIVKGKGLFGLSSKNKIGSLKSFHNHYNREEKRITICAKCKQELGKGKRHRCDSSSTYKNLLNFVSELPKKNRDQIVHNIINQDAANKSNSNL